MVRWFGSRYEVDGAEDLAPVGLDQDQAEKWGGVAVLALRSITRERGRSKDAGGGRVREYWAAVIEIRDDPSDESGS